jgi:hypothetical protein
MLAVMAAQRPAVTNLNAEGALGSVIVAGRQALESGCQQQPILIQVKHQGGQVGEVAHPVKLPLSQDRSPQVDKATKSTEDICCFAREALAVLNTQLQPRQARQPAQRLHVPLLPLEPAIAAGETDLLQSFE